MSFALFVSYQMIPADGSEPFFGNGYFSIPDSYAITPYAVEEIASHIEDSECPGTAIVISFSILDDMGQGDFDEAEEDAGPEISKSGNIIFVKFNRRTDDRR